MKIWSNPVAIAQQFAANEYVSACYSVLCTTPHGNKKYTHCYNDVNLNGLYDEGVDTLVADVKADFGMDWFRGCNGRHDVVVHGDLPTNNAVVVDAQGNNPTAPCFYWTGNVLGEFDPNKYYTEGIHSTDLSNPENIILADNPNFS